MTDLNPEPVLIEANNYSPNDHCPACAGKMSGSLQIIDDHIRRDSSLWLCTFCGIALLNARMVKSVRVFSGLLFWDKFMMLFFGRTPKSWIHEWHKFRDQK